MSKQSIINFSDIKNLSMSVQYRESFPVKPYESKSHIHNECEIYINLSGDVSFMVEKTIYPVLPGNIVITKPFEYHHCIYHSDAIHKHFWILISSEGNEKILDVFFKRKSGENNLLAIPQDKKDELINLCDSMISNQNTSELKKYNNFFALLDILQSAEMPEKTTAKYPDTVLTAIEYIDNNLENNISIKELADLTHVSINTLERHFKETLRMTPKMFIKKKRLANAVKLLTKGESVARASEKSGFSDFSSFITLFKKNYGVTPLKYKKQMNIKG